MYGNSGDKTMEGQQADGDKIRDFVFVKMRQSDVEFMKSSIQHLKEQARQGWGPSYSSAPWVLVMLLPFVSFVLAVVLRSSLASLVLSTALSFLLFMRIYATQAQSISKVARLKQKVNRYQVKVERMQDEIDVAGQELKESVREQLRLNEFSTLLQDRLADLERGTKRARFASPRDIEKKEAESSDGEQAATPQFKHRKRGRTQIIKYFPEEVSTESAGDGEGEGDDGDGGVGEERTQGPKERSGGVKAGGEPERAKEERREEAAEREGAGRGERGKKTKQEDEREFIDFVHRMNDLRERDRRLIQVQEEGEDVGLITTRERPDWRDEKDESEDGSIRVRTVGDLSSEADEDDDDLDEEEDVVGLGDDSDDVGSQHAGVAHRPRLRDYDQVQESYEILRRRLELENVQRKREEKNEAMQAHKKTRGGSSRQRVKGSRITIHLATSASTSALDPLSSLIAKPLTSSNSCIPTFSSKSSPSSPSPSGMSADQPSDSDGSVPPPTPPPPPPPALIPSPSSRFKFRFFPHISRRHSSNSPVHLASAPPPSPLSTTNAAQQSAVPTTASPPPSPRGLSTSSPTNTRPFTPRKRGDSFTHTTSSSSSSSSSPPLPNGSSALSSSPPFKSKRGSMLLSLLPFTHEKDRDREKEKERERERERESNDDEAQDHDEANGDRDSSDEGNGEGGSHHHRTKKKLKTFAMRRMRSKEDERLICKREERDKVKDEKDKAKEEKKRAKEERDRVKSEEKEEAKERREEKEPKKRLVDGVKRLYHRRTRSAAAIDIAKDM